MNSFPVGVALVCAACVACMFFITDCEKEGLKHGYDPAMAKRIDRLPSTDTEK